MLPTPATGRWDSRKGLTCCRVDDSARWNPSRVNAPDSGAATEEVAVAYSEEPLEIGFNARYLLEIAPDDLDAVRETLGELPHDVIATVQDAPTITMHSGTEKISIELERLREAWSGDAVAPGSEPA